MQNIRESHQKKNPFHIILNNNGSWYQPAIDAFTYSLMRQFNKLPSHSEPLDKKSEQDIRPLVYTTFQAYLRRSVFHFSFKRVGSGDSNSMQNTCIPPSRHSRCQDKQLRPRRKTCPWSIP